MSETSTYRSANTLSPYFKEIQRTHPLSRPEERQLASRIQKGDLEARNRLVSANLRFALDMARRYQGRGLPLEDLISMANIGLLEAAKRFDGLSGVRFITYAVWWIRQSVLKALSGERRTVHLPGHITDLLHKIHRASEELEQELERPPITEEIASRLDVSIRAVRTAMDSSQEIQSLDETLGTSDEGEFRLMDVLEDTEVDEPLDLVEQTTEKQEVRQSLHELKPREFEVIQRYYGLDGDPEGNLAEIGRELHLSRERVRQIKDKALSRLRQQYKSRHVSYYCEEEEELELAV